jgi:hypothetical protein
MNDETWLSLLPAEPATVADGSCLIDFILAYLPSPVDRRE